MTKISQLDEEIKQSSKLIMNVPYFQTPNSIYDDEHDLNTLAIAVYCYLARCGNQGAVAFPSLPTIGRKCKMSRSSAAESIKSLVKYGYLTKKTIPGIGCEYEIMAKSEPVQQADGTRPAGGPVTRPAGGPKKELSFKKNYKKEKDLKEGNTPQETTAPPAKPSPNLIDEIQEPKQTAADEVLRAGLKYYRDNYELRTDRKPAEITGADVKNLKAAVKGISAKDLNGCLALMFDDDWYQQRGWPLKTFASQINQFLAKLAMNEKHPEHRYLNDAPANVKNALRLVEKYKKEEGSATNDLTNYSDPKNYERLYDSPLPNYNEIAPEPATAEFDRVLSEAEIRGNRIDYLKNIIEIRQGLGSSNEPEALTRLERYRKELAELEALQAAGDNVLPINPVIKCADNVTMTAAEYNQLIEHCNGKEYAARGMIEILNNYKNATGKTYKNDYSAILNWVVKKYEQDNGPGYKDRRVIES